MPWRDWQPDVERQFNPRAWATDVEAQHALRGRLSAAARARLKGEFDVAYGDTPRQALDIYRAGDAEAPGWATQTHEYAVLCEQAGCKVEVIIMSHESHFSTIPVQVDAGHPVNQAMLRDLRGIAGNSGA